MYKILRKEVLNTSVVLMEVEAPFVARKAQPGQFVILRVDEDGERIPLTISDFDREKGIITIIFRAVGATTLKLSQKNEGEYIQDFAGPLGVPTRIDGLKKVCIIGGGVIDMEGFPKEILFDAVHFYARKPYPEKSLRLLFTRHDQKSGVFGSGIFAQKQIMKRGKPE